MKSFFYYWFARLFGRNLQATPPSVIIDQMNELRPLPLGVPEFEEWSDRIMSGACIPQVHEESQKATLASMLLHLGPTEDHKADAFFIKGLRKLGVNQVGNAMFAHYRELTKARTLLADQSQGNGAA